MGQVEKDTILWVQTITKSCFTVCIELLVEDQSKNVIPLGLYNYVNKNIKLNQLNQMFYKGIQFGIKQPYLVCSYGGIHSLRNDNPINILFTTKSTISNNSIQSSDNLE